MGLQTPSDSGIAPPGESAKIHAMDVWDTIELLRQRGERFVVVTVSAQRGSVPAETGAKAVVTRDGLIAGNLGGGKVEVKAVAAAVEMLDGTEECRLVTWNLQQDVGMTCGGEMTLLLERVCAEPPWHVLVFGAGHVSQALVRLLATLRCKVDVVDTRDEWLSRLPASDRVTAHKVETFEQGVDLASKDSFVVSITMGHSTDRPVLSSIMKRFGSLPYLGVIGSASKRAVLIRELKEDGIALESLDALICPIGLPLGNNDPAEIAVSVAAQLIQTRDAIKVAPDRSPA